MRAAAEGEVSQSAGYRWYVLAVLFLVTLFNVADRYILHTLLQPIKEEFGASDTAVLCATSRQHPEQLEFHLRNQ